MGAIRRGFAAMLAEWSAGLAQIPVRLPEFETEYEGLHFHTLSIEEVSALLQARGIRIPGQEGKSYPCTVDVVGESLQEAVEQLSSIEGNITIQTGPFYIARDEDNQQIFSLSLDLGYVDAMELEEAEDD